MSAVITKNNVAGYNRLAPYQPISSTVNVFYNAGDVLEGSYDGTRFHATGMWLDGVISLLPTPQTIVVNDSRYDSMGNPEKTLIYSTANTNNIGNGYKSVIINPAEAFGRMYRIGQYVPNVYNENYTPFAFYKLKTNFVSNYNNASINQINMGKPVVTFPANKYVYGNVIAIAKGNYNTTGSLKYALLTKVGMPSEFPYANILSFPNQYAIPLELLSEPIAASTVGMTPKPLPVSTLSFHGNFHNFMYGNG